MPKNELQSKKSVHPKCVLASRETMLKRPTLTQQGVVNK